MPRFLFVVSCSSPARFDMVQRRLAGRDDVEVTLDRRFRERRRRDDRPMTERRRAERRQHDVQARLDDLGWVVVLRPTT